MPTNYSLHDALTAILKNHPEISRAHLQNFQERALAYTKSGDSCFSQIINLEDTAEDLFVAIITYMAKHRRVPYDGWTKALGAAFEAARRAEARGGTEPCSSPSQKSSGECTLQPASTSVISPHVGAGSCLSLIGKRVELRVGAPGEDVAFSSYNREVGQVIEQQGLAVVIKLEDGEKTICVSLDRYDLEICEEDDETD